MDRRRFPVRGPGLFSVSASFCRGGQEESSGDQDGEQDQENVLDPAPFPAVVVSDPAAVVSIVFQLQLLLFL
jgi:hypothetical protein